MKHLLFALIFCWSLFSARSEDSSLPTIFVAPLDGDASAVMGWQPALGEGLAEMLITELGKINNSGPRITALNISKAKSSSVRMASPGRKV
jgi:hypothetical protein